MRNLLKKAHGATESRAPRESQQTVYRPAGLRRGTRERKRPDISLVFFFTRRKTKQNKEKNQEKKEKKGKKTTRKLLDKILTGRIRAGAGACVRAHAPSWALRVWSAFISSQGAKNNGSSERTPKQGTLNGKSKTGEESGEVGTETCITLHSKNKKINQCHHLLHKGLRECRYRTGQEGAQEP